MDRLYLEGQVPKCSQSRGIVNQSQEHLGHKESPSDLMNENSSENTSKIKKTHEKEIEDKGTMPNLPCIKVNIIYKAEATLLPSPNP
jgi:hypothetical protein